MNFDNTDLQQARDLISSTIRDETQRKGITKQDVANAIDRVLDGVENILPVTVPLNGSTTQEVEHNKGRLVQVHFCDPDGNTIGIQYHQDDEDLDTVTFISNSNMEGFATIF